MQIANYRRIFLFYGLPLICILTALIVRTRPLRGYNLGPTFMATAGILLILLVLATVFIALHHADTIAKHLGEPWGTLVLTFAVTAIEVSIIISMMLHGENNPTLARSSVFSTVMIVCSGLVGICMTFGGWRHRNQEIKRQGTSAFLAVLIAITVLTMILPNYTLTTSPGTFSTAQLAFVSILSVFLYASFIFAQVVSQREDFMEAFEGELAEADSQSTTNRAAMKHGVFLLISLLGIVLLTEEVASRVEDALHHFQISQADSIVGALIALIVLMPEALSAIRASMANELQRGLNIALGSACATIGLTIPAVAMGSLITGRGLTLGLDANQTVLLLLSHTICIVSFGTGRTTTLTGVTHLAVFLTFILLTIIP